MVCGARSWVSQMGVRGGTITETSTDFGELRVSVGADSGGRLANQGSRKSETFNHGAVERHSHCLKLAVILQTRLQIYQPRISARRFDSNSIFSRLMHVRHASSVFLWTALYR